MPKHSRSFTITISGDDPQILAEMEGQVADVAINELCILQECPEYKKTKYGYTCEAST